MNTPYHELKGATRIFGYVSESGEKIPVRMFPNDNLDQYKIKIQLGHIEEEFCKEKIKNKNEDQLEPDDLNARAAAKAKAAAKHPERFAKPKAFGMNEAYGHEPQQSPSGYDASENHAYHYDGERKKFFHNRYGNHPWKPGDRYDEDEHLQRALNHHLNKSGQFATRKEAHFHALDSTGASDEKIMDHMYPDKESRPEHKILDVFRHKIAKRLKAHDSHVTNLKAIAEVGKK